MIPIPRFCVLCGSHVVGMWRIPRNTVWNVARVLLLCSKCAAREGAYCTHVDGLDDCEPSYPFLAAADLPIAVSLGICWCEPFWHAIVPWCPAHGVRVEHLREIERYREELTS